MTLGLNQRRDGFAVIVVFVLLTVMSVYLIANVVALGILKRELQTIEKSQKHRIEKVAQHHANLKIQPPNPVK